MNHTIPISIKIFLLILLSIIFPIKTSGQDYGDFNVKGRWPYGPSYAVAVQGDLAAFGNGAVVQLVDLSNRLSPLPFAQIELFAMPRDMEIIDDILFVTLDEIGLVLYDVSDPYAPSFISSLDEYLWQNQMVVDGDWVYISDGAGDISFINLSDKNNPFIETKLHVTSKARELILHDDLLIAMVKDSVIVIDVRNPASPVKLTAQFVEFCTDAAVQNDKLFLAMNNNSLLIYDFTNPTNLIQESSYLKYGRFVKIEVIGDTIFAAGTAGRLTVYKMEADSILQIGQYKDGGFISDMVIADSYAYCANNHQGALILDLEDPTTPTVRFKKDNFSFTTGLEVKDGTAYVANWLQGLLIFDVTVSDQPKIIGSYLTGTEIFDVVLHDQLAFLIELEADIRIMDVSDPTAPVELADLDLRGETFDVDIQGDLVYAAQSHAGLYIIEISDPSNPVILDSLPIEGDLLNLDVQGDYVYIANGQRGMRIIDISDPKNPSEKGNYDDEQDATITVSSIHDVVVNENTAYLADHSNGFHIVDISDKSNPKQIINNWVPGRSFALRYKEEQLFIAAQYKGIHALNVQDPTNPILLATFQTGSRLEDLSLDFDKIYISDFECGFTILSLKTSTSNQLIADSREIQMKVFPNPIVDQSMITFELQQPSRISIVVSDMSGKRRMTILEDDFSNGYNEVRLGLISEQLGVGIYTIEINVGDKQYAMLITIP